MEKSQKTLLTGVKSSGIIHIGNYFGAMKPLLLLSQEYDETLIFVADLHALTTVQNKKELSLNIRHTVAAYLASGFDPEKVTIYKQSDVPQVCELAWIFSCITTMPYLMRAHAFKDAEVKKKEINAGVFNYPLLMAADILIQQADVIPVGLDQKQHLEIARDTAEKFNRVFGDTFTLPEPRIEKTLQTIPGTDGRKMSKSYGNVIPLFASDDEIQKHVMAIPTDSKGIDDPKDPADDKVFALHRLFNPQFEELEKRYREGGVGYQESKEMLIGYMKDFIAPLRDKYEKICADEQLIKDTLEKGGQKARKRAKETMKEVRENVGINF